MERRFVRNLFSNELEEVCDDPRAEFEVLNERSRAKVAWAEVGTRYANPYDTGKDHVSLAMSIPPEQATRERIERENAQARHAGTFAYYTPDGECHLPTRRSRAKEMRRRGYQDNQAGYSDYGG